MQCNNLCFLIFSLHVLDVYMMGLRAEQSVMANLPYHQVLMLHDDCSVIFLGGIQLMLNSADAEFVSGISGRYSADTE